MGVRLGDKIADSDGRSAWISKEEKQRTQAFLMKRLEDVMAGRTYEEFAEDVGLSAANIYNYRSGIRFPTAYALKRIAERCDVSVDWLLGVRE